VSDEAVGFDDELRVGPCEVRFVALDLGVDLGAGKVVAGNDGEEAPFQLCLRHLRWTLGCGQELGAAAARAGANDGSEGSQVE